MRKRTIIRDVRDAIPDKAMDLAGRLGDGLRHAVPDGAGKWLNGMPQDAGSWLSGMQQGAGKWLQAGVALGAARTGARAAGIVARRHPVALTAAAIGIGAAAYAVVRHRRKAAELAAMQRRPRQVREALESADLGVEVDARDTSSRPQSQGEDD
ncbi:MULTISPECIES: hypothetical protein [unclassified Luteimonas]